MADLPFYIGFQTSLDVRQKVEEIFMRIEEDAFGYLSEILATAKKTFKSSKIEPLPKTPSAKRSRRKITRRKIEELNEEDEENNPPAKRLSLHPEADHMRDDSPQIHTRTTRAAAKRATTSRTIQKSSINKNDTNQSEKNKSTPVVCKDKAVQKEILECETRESKCSPLSSVQERLKHSCSPQKPLHKFCLMNVKEKASVYEEMIHLNDNNAAHPSRKTPIASPSKKLEETTDTLKVVCSNYRSGSIHRSGSNRKASHLDTHKSIRRSSRASVRKSLQMLKSHQALKKSGTFEKLEATPSTKPSRTRLRLKKPRVSSFTEAELATPKRNEDVENAPSACHEFSNVQETNVEDRANEDTSKRCTRTKIRKSASNSTCAAEISADANIEAVSCEVLAQTSAHPVAQIGVGNTSQMSHDAADSENTCSEVSINKSTRTKVRRPSTTNGESAAVIEITQNKGINMESDDSKIVKSNENEGSISHKDIDDHQTLSAKPVRSTRTRQRVAERTAGMSTNSQLERDSQSDVDSGIGSVTKVGRQESLEDKPQVTRSKMRKPNSNRGTDELCTSSDHDDVFVVPSMPPTRMTRTKTRKRQLDEGSDTEINTSKRSHLDSETSDQERKDEESYMDVTTNEESHEEDGVHSSLFTPAAKIIHPASFLNSLNKTSANSALRPASLATGIVRSFIKRNTPPQPTMEELHNRRKMALEEKERLHQERLKYRDLQHKRKMEELKRKREEKMKKAAELREKLHSEESRHRILLNRKMHQKEQVLEAMKEEKLKEEREKHKIRQQKLQEAEERRLQEQKDWEKKVQEQLAEEKKHRELLQKKKELEELERQQKLQEESQKHKEKLAEIEKEREAEAERLRLIEEEKQREWQRKKEERERMLAQEKAEKERMELEKKRERELQMKKDIERQKELEKKRLEEEEQQKERERQMQEEIKKQLNKHNAQLIQQQQQNIVSHTSLKGMPKPNLNRTLTLTEPQIVKTLASNPNSYEMTPVRMHKKSPSEDNYDISNLHSDDSTDDEDAPRKKIPLWAQGAHLKAALINQHYHPPNLERMFPHIDPPDLNLLFEKKRARFNKRTSSAHWDSPILLPCKI